MISHTIGEIPFVPDPGELVVSQHMTYSIVHRRQPTGEAGVLLVTTQRVVLYRQEVVSGNLSLSFNTYYSQIFKIKRGSAAGNKFIEINGSRIYLRGTESKAVHKLIKLGRRGKVKRMGAHVTAVARSRQPTMQQQRPPQPQRAPQPQPNVAMDPIYAKGLESVANEIVQQLVPKPAAAPAVAPASQVQQPVTTIAASRSMVMKPTVNTAVAITSAEAVAAKRAMLERVLAPQSRDAQALASEVMGSIAGTKAVKGLKKGAAGGASDGSDAAIAPLDNTENEVTAIKEQKICIVHKGPISGAIFLCPKCETFYCLKCAIYLKKNGERCWSCKAEIDVPDMEA